MPTGAVSLPLTLLSNSKEGNVREGKKILYVFVRSNFPEMMTQCLRIITDYYYF